MNRHSSMARMKYLTAAFLLMVFCAAQPLQAMTMQEQIDNTILRMEQAALKDDQGSFAALKASLEAANTPEAFVALGKLYGNLPTKYILRIKRYAESAEYYRKAIARGAELNQDTKAVNEARIGLARHILQDRIDDRGYAAAEKLLQLAIESGNPNAAYILGRRLERGVGDAPPDYEKAEYWYRYALRGKAGEAAIALVSLYKRGYITPPTRESQDKLSALGITLLRERTDRGDATAAYRLGRVYALGIAVPADRAEARKWYDVAAALGSVSALKELAVISSRDDNDAVRAAQYMVKAAESGSINAAVELGKRLNRQDGYYLDISPEIAQLWVERAASLGNLTAIGILADQLMAQGKSEEAVEYLEEAAENGSMESYLTLYQMFKSGQGVEKNDARALAYFRRAMALENLNSGERLKLGTIMLTPSETAYLPREGLAMVESAARTSDTKAMAFLADGYEKGIFGAPDNQKAIAWRQKAADAGDVGSMLALSLNYEEGKIVERDRRKANIIFNQTLNTVAPDDASALLMIGQAYVEGKIVAPDMDEAAEWYKRALDAGSEEGLVALGRLVKWNAVKDYRAEEAVGMFKKAASAGSISAMVELGMLYSMGMLVPIDPSMAFEYFRLAADGGSLEGLRQVGLAYLSGIGVEKNEEEGLRYLRQAANSGNAFAMLDIGNIHAMRGEKREAVNWWQKASAGNLSDAYYFLALAYQNGDGVERNAEKARSYMQTASRLDNYQAQLDLQTANQP